MVSPKVNMDILHNMQTHVGLLRRFQRWPNILLVYTRAGYISTWVWIVMYFGLTSCGNELETTDPLLEVVYVHMSLDFAIEHAQ